MVDLATLPQKVLENGQVLVEIEPNIWVDLVTLMNKE